MEYGEYIHSVRMALEEPIFDILRANYGAKLKQAWDQAEFPQTSSNTVLLVERRPHPNIEFVLHNFMYFANLGERKFSLTIACSKENEGYIRKILGKHEATTNILVVYETDCGRDQARQEYNTLMKSEEFWQKIDAEYILSMQTDCYLRKALPESIWTVDYVAAPWAWKPWVVGGSGLTFRRKEAVIDMCRQKFKKEMAEDEFFAHMCLHTKKRFLPLEVAEHIFSESRFVLDPVGVHQWWTYLSQVNFEEERDKEFFNKHFKIYTTLNLS